MSTCLSSHVPIKAFGQLAHASEATLHIPATEVRVASINIPTSSLPAIKDFPADEFRTTLTPKKVGFHDPLDRAAHILSQLPKQANPAKQRHLEEGVLSVLKAEAHADRESLSQQRQFRATMEKSGIKLENPMGFIANVFNGTPFAQTGMDAMQRHKQSVEKLQEGVSKRKDAFEATLDPETKLAWQRAYESSGADALPSVHERAGYLLSRLDRTGTQKLIITQSQREQLHGQLKTYLSGRDALDYGLMGQMSPKIRQGWMQLMIPDRLAPGVLDEQVDFIHSRLPVQSSLGKEAELRQHIQKGLEVSRKLARPSIEMLMQMLPALKGKQQANPVAALRDLNSSMAENTKQLDSRHQFVQSLDTHTQVAWNKAHRQLFKLTSTKPMSLLSKLSEAVEV